MQPAVARGTWLIQRNMRRGISVADKTKASYLPDNSVSTRPLLCELQITVYLVIYISCCHLRG